MMLFEVVFGCVNWMLVSRVLLNRKLFCGIIMICLCSEENCIC